MGNNDLSGLPMVSKGTYAIGHLAVNSGKYCNAREDKTLPSSMLEPPEFSFSAAESRGMKRNTGIDQVFAARNSSWALAARLFT